MKKNLIFLFVFMMFMGIMNVYAQGLKNHRQAMMDQKKEYIKTNFKVSQASEVAFWKAYDKNAEAEMNVYKEQRAMKEAANLPHWGDTTALTDEQIIEKYRINLVTKRKLLAIEETYFSDLKKVLSPQELDAYYKLEKKFLHSAVAKKNGGK